jgi:hypothetical protein
MQLAASGFPQVRLATSLLLVSASAKHYKLMGSKVFLKGYYQEILNRIATDEPRNAGTLCHFLTNITPIIEGCVTDRIINEYTPTTIQVLIKRIFDDRLKTEDSLFIQAAFSALLSIEPNYLSGSDKWDAVARYGQSLSCIPNNIPQENQDEIRNGLFMLMTVIFFCEA